MWAHILLDRSQVSVSVLEPGRMILTNRRSRISVRAYSAYLQTETQSATTHGEYPRSYVEDEGNVRTAEKNHASVCLRFGLYRWTFFANTTLVRLPVRSFVRVCTCLYAGSHIVRGRRAWFVWCGPGSCVRPRTRWLQPVFSEACRTAEMMAFS